MKLHVCVIFGMIFGFLANIIVFLSTRKIDDLTLFFAIQAMMFCFGVALVLLIRLIFNITCDSLEGRRRR